MPLIPLTGLRRVAYFASSKVICADREEVTDVPNSIAKSLFAMSFDASLADLAA